MSVRYWLVKLNGTLWTNETNEKYVNYGEKNEMINITWAWDKEKIWVPNRNQTHDLPNTRWVHVLSSELQELMESKAI